MTPTPRQSPITEAGVDLIERLEAATEESRKLDAAVAIVSEWKPLGPIKHWIHDWPAGFSTGIIEGYVYLVDAPVPDTKWPSPPFTTSLDAARTLLPRGTLWSAGCMEFGCFARLCWPMPDGGYAGGGIDANGATAALALIIAALRARAALPAAPDAGGEG